MSLDWLDNLAGSTPPKEESNINIQKVEVEVNAWSEEEIEIDLSPEPVTKPDAKYEDLPQKRQEDQKSLGWEEEDNIEVSDNEFGSAIDDTEG